MTSIHYNFDDLFVSDFFGLKWTETDQKVIHWRVETNILEVPASQPYLIKALPILSETKFQYKEAFKLWDENLELLSFVETYDIDKTDIAIAVVPELPNNAFGVWNATFEDKLFQKATVQFQEDIIDQPFFFTVLLHEIGNVIGLGDISPRSDIRSVQEDPFPELFTGKALWSDDIAMVDQLYAQNIASTISIKTNTITGNDLEGVTLLVRSELFDEVEVYKTDKQIKFNWNLNDQVSIEAELSYEYYSEAMDLNDVIHILRLSVGLPDEIQTKHFEYIAADLNRDTKITSDDALQLLLYLFDMQTEYDPKWVFLDSDQNFSTIDADGVLYSEGLNITVNSQPVDATLTGILIGDADLSHTEIII